MWWRLSQEGTKPPMQTSTYSNVHTGWNIVAVLLFLTAIVNIVWFVYSTVNRPSLSIQQGNFSIFINPDALFAFLKTRIAIALVLSVLGLLIGHRSGLVISVLALVWISAEYVVWWLKSISAVRQSGNATFSKVEHTAFLLQGNWWDLWVIVIVGVMLISEIRLLSTFENQQLPRPLLFR